MAKDLYEYSIEELETEIRNRSRRDAINEALTGAEIFDVRVSQEYTGHCEMTITYRKGGRGA